MNSFAWCGRPVDGRQFSRVHGCKIVRYYKLDKYPTRGRWVTTAYIEEIPDVLFDNLWYGGR